MKALVTGAGGFLGLYLVEQLLAAGHEVRALGRGRYPALAALPIETRQVDVRDRAAVVAACQGIDTVFHAAGLAGIWGPWEEFHGINTLGTQHVIEGCLAHGVARLVFTSSPSVTFDGQDQCGVDESAPYPARYLCHYAHTKALAEQAVLAAHRPGVLLTCALRPHLIWGPRDTQLTPRLIARAKAGQLRRVGAGKNLVDTIYVENAARAHLEAAAALAPSSPVGGRAYFLSQSEPVNCWQWIDRLLGLAGLPPVARAIPEPVARWAGGGLELAYRLLRRRDEPRMTRFLAAQLAKSHYFDISRARADFGYRPWVSTDEGLERTLPDLRRAAS